MPRKHAHELIEIYVNSAYGTSASVEIDLNDSIATLRRKLLNENIIKNFNHPLVFLNKNLKNDNLTLKELGIKQSSTIYKLPHTTQFFRNLEDDGAEHNPTPPTPGQK